MTCRGRNTRKDIYLSSYTVLSEHILFIYRVCIKKEQDKEMENPVLIKTDVKNQLPDTHRDDQKNL